MESGRGRTESAGCAWKATNGKYVLPILPPHRSRNIRSTRLETSVPTRPGDDERVTAEKERVFLDHGLSGSDAIPAWKSANRQVDDKESPLSRDASLLKGRGRPTRTDSVSQINKPRKLEGGGRSRCGDHEQPGIQLLARQKQAGSAWTTLGSPTGAVNRAPTGSIGSQSFRV
ncbi:hypothetical protein MTO96_015578 [Rhipicephalus appendiculatus]